MVGARHFSRAIVGHLFIALLLVLVFAAPLCCRADEKAEPTITEEYGVTVNPVGDAHIMDTIKYSDEDFKAVKNVEDDNKGFLTRRYRTDDNRGELVDFDVQFNDSDNSVAITYDKPGFAYYTGGEWVVFGLSNEPAKRSGRTFTFEEQTTTNSEFTLFTDQEILTTTKIELPQAASGHRHDPEDGSIRYKMPAAQTLLGFWSDNRTTLSVVFGLCTMLLAGLLLFVLTRKTAEPCIATTPVPDAASGGATPPPAAGPSDSATPIPQADGALPAGFCGRCGKSVGEGKKFCPHCGAPR